jgi:transcriptional regulator with XRE-family HTH domain
VDKLNLDYISHRRNELGLTLQDMAEALGFKNASTYLKYEKGVYCFRANHLPIMARRLKCTLDSLFMNISLLKQKINSDQPGKSGMLSWEANKRQLEIWKKTLTYEIEMMAPRSSIACEGFVHRLNQFEKQIEDGDTGDTCRALS